MWGSEEKLKEWADSIDWRNVLNRLAKWNGSFGYTWRGHAYWETGNWKRRRVVKKKQDRSELEEGGRTSVL